ncbi:LysE family translocator [Psychromonas ossibalaenae]|uniref:LysE family translocator n=1 Tax=Psychromonas ossibalaenae TaxID=444922 RepID=UPI0003676B8E|nr:LysE family translocator [Psychromonas ossibalaenae]
MSLESAVTFFIAIFIFSITPGPGVFTILSRALVDGVKSCIMLALGMVVSDLAFLILACFGLATIAENWSEVFLVIRYAGAAYLIYLGYKMFKALPQIKEDMGRNTAKNKHALLAGFTQGFLISASNPKVILFYIAFLPTFIDLTVLQSQDIVLAAVLTSIALMAGLMLIAFGAAKMAGILKTPLAHKRLNRGAGSIMILAGTYLAVNR